MRFGQGASKGNDMLAARYNKASCLITISRESWNFDSTMGVMDEQKNQTRIYRSLIGTFKLRRLRFVLKIQFPSLSITRFRGATLMTL